jgi:outer membrane protein OmpA-like peptidoglycan-associated protein
MISLLATVAMMGTGVASMTGCAAHEQVTATVPAPEVVVPPPTAAVVVAPPPAPTLVTVCDAEIRPFGHLHFPHEVEFDEGKATIKSTPTTSAILQCLVDFLNNNPIVTKFRLEGYTDNRGDAALNAALSEARANAIVAFLVSKNVPAGKLWAKGFGPAKPVAPNDSPENMAKNRRVEFHIDELGGAKATKEAIAIAMNPPAVATLTTSTSVAVPAPPTVAVTVPSVQVAVPTASMGVTTTKVVVPSSVTTTKVVMPSAGVSVGAPSVSVGVGIGIGGGAGGGAKPAAKKDDKKAAPAEEKKDDKKDEKKK